MDMADIRRDYRKGDLDRGDLEGDPIAQFNKWFADAAAAQAGTRSDVNAMTLATVDKEGRPSTRTLLLKGADARGFIFFTNYESRKGMELATNPNAAMTFFWPEIERQVCVAGTVTKLSAAESETYFKSRPRGSQLSAWASNQSEVVSDRDVLEQKWREIEARFPKDVPLPPTWGGYVLAPARVEFWQGRASRLHDRFRYEKQADGSWRIDRLSP